MASSSLYVILIIVLISSGLHESECVTTISTDVLPYILRVPCNETEDECSFQNFMKQQKTNVSEFLESWLIVLYIEGSNYSSIDVISDDTAQYTHRTLIQHQIILGKIRCFDGADESNVALILLCGQLGPSVLYSFLHGMLSEYWWTISDLLTHRTFVLGNILTLQYKSHLIALPSTDYQDRLQSVINGINATRKYALVIHMQSGSVEVNTTAPRYIDPYESASFEVRFKTFEFLGLVLRNNPNSRVVFVTGAIESELEIWWYDSSKCSDVKGYHCDTVQLVTEDIKERSTDEMLCNIERFGQGIVAVNTEDKAITIPDNISNVEYESNIKRLLHSCPFVLFTHETPEPSMKTKEMATNVSKALFDFEIVSVTASTNWSRRVFENMQLKPDFAKHNVFLKLHTNKLKKDEGEMYSNLNSPSGLQILLKSMENPDDSVQLIATINEMITSFHRGRMSDYDEDDVEFNPYVETDELFILWQNQKEMVSDYFHHLDNEKFKALTAANADPIIVLFYQPWTSNSVYSRDIIFPAAANFLALNFGIKDRLYAVNCYDYNELCHREKIIQYPVVKTYYKGKSQIFTETTSIPNIVRRAFALGQRTIYHPKTPKEVETILNYTKSVVDHVVMAVDIEDKIVLGYLEGLASLFRGKEFFIVCSHKDLPANLKKEIGKEAIVSYSRRFKPNLITLHHSNLDDVLEEFVLNSHHGRVMQLTWDLFNALSPVRPLIILVTYHMYPKLECLLTGIATQRMGQVYVTWMLGHKGKDTIFKGFDSPELIFRDTLKGALYRHNISAAQLSSTQNCSRIDPIIDKWLDRIMADKQPADGFMLVREFQPPGNHIDATNYIYPRQMKNPMKEQKSHDTGPNEVHGTSEASVKDDEVPIHKVETPPPGKTRIPDDMNVDEGPVDLGGTPKLEPTSHTHYPDEL